MVFKKPLILYALDWRSNLIIFPQFSICVDLKEWGSRWIAWIFKKILNSRCVWTMLPITCMLRWADTLAIPSPYFINLKKRVNDLFHHSSIGPSILGLLDFGFPQPSDFYIFIFDFMLEYRYCTRIKICSYKTCKLVKI